MSRKKKKQARERKAIKHEVLSETDNQSCWDLGRQWSKEKLIRLGEYKNHKSYCTDCKQFFCLGFDLIDAFCRDCFYKGCCKKDTEHRRLCQRCWRVT